MMIEHDDKQIEEALSELKIETSSRKLMKKTLTNYEILSQAFMFLMAGSGTTSSTLNFLAYLLAKHPDVQNKLYSEIEKAFNKYVSVAI